MKSDKVGKTIRVFEPDKDEPIRIINDDAEREKLMADTSVEKFCIGEQKITREGQIFAWVEGKWKFVGPRFGNCRSAQIALRDIAMMAKACNTSMMTGILKVQEEWESVINKFNQLSDQLEHSKGQYVQN